MRLSQLDAIIYLVILPLSFSIRLAVSPNLVILIFISIYNVSGHGAKLNIIKQLFMKFVLSQITDSFKFVY